MYLSKSDFQLGTDCPQKLVYKKKNYPTTNDTNEYMEMLAKGGYIVGTMATYLFPGGVEIEGNMEEAIAATREFMQQENCILFESAHVAGQKLARVDILVKKGNDLHLLEVKSKSFESEEDSYKQRKSLEKYLQDVSYQYLILTEAYPELNIRCSLLMPDKSYRTDIDGLAGWFVIEPEPRETDWELEELPARARPRFRRPRVRFKYENHPERVNYMNQLMSEQVLNYYDATEKAREMREEILRKANILIEVINENSAEGLYEINKGCKACEFRTGGEEPNGFRECWGEMADTDPHIFDLYFGGSIGSAKKGFYLDELISQRKSGLFDIDPERLKNAKGELSSRGERQQKQIQFTRDNIEWISEELKGRKPEFRYPFHFIDFETYIGALPFHSGMRPYELLAFQWSCHTIERENAEPEHSEWIHTGGDFPNFQFALALKDRIGDNGTPFMWATHENTVLRMILGQMEHRNFQDDSLKEWLIRMTTDKDQPREGRLVDMNKMTLDYYFHPLMKGRTSIKKVLPAIWQSHPYLHDIPHFSEYKKVGSEGGIIDPYDTLAQLSDEDTGEEVVSGGTAAMRAYYRMRFDDSLNPDQKEELKRQLLAYCKLDTLSQVIIAHHWGIR